MAANDLGMRGFVQTISRLPAAPRRSLRAFIAGAAFLAGAATSAMPHEARAQTGTGNGDESAMAMPRIAPLDGGVALPQPLAPSLAARIRRIFNLQAHVAIAEATSETAALDDKLLVGHILADRYLSPRTKASVAELQAWLDSYADQPDAPAIRVLLIRRLPKGAPPPPELAWPPADAPDQDGPRLPEAVDAPDPAVAARPAHARARAAQVLFTHNKDVAALDRAVAAFRAGPTDQRVGLAGYIAGLAAWRLGRIEQARGLFEAAARAPVTAASTRAAAAYWAARANVRLGDADEWTPWMRRAADQPRTFYGLLARRCLGLGAGLSNERELLTPADVDSIATLPGGRRAFALLQVGQDDRAAAELRRLWPDVKSQPGLNRALMLVAREAGFTDLAADIATEAQGIDGHPHDQSRFPIPRLAPRGGFRLDPALVYAVTRLESNFDPSVVSGAGARGLMQLMPVTAGYIGNDPSLAGAGRKRLHEPGLNLEIGQRYLMFLAQKDGIDNDLIRILASYNSGTGSFNRWSTEVRDQGDPLLFIESIPNAETRGFVQHVLAYSWIYAARLRLPSPSLDALAAGRFPQLPAGSGEATQQAIYRLH